MATATLVSVEEYLGMSYRPDREYLDGRIVERNLGDRNHSDWQMAVSAKLYNRRVELGVHVFPEQRIRISPTRYRVPDICVVSGPKPDELVFTRPPFLCIEILSKDDRAEDVQDCIDDYLGLGVPYVWVINPRSCRAWIHTSEGSHEAKDGLLRTQNPEIIVPLDEILAAL